MLQPSTSVPQAGVSVLALPPDGAHVPVGAAKPLTVTEPGATLVGSATHSPALMGWVLVVVGVPAQGAFL